MGSDEGGGFCLRVFSRLVGLLIGVMIFRWGFLVGGCGWVMGIRLNINRTYVLIIP